MVTEFRLFIFIDNKWSETNTIVKGIIKEEMYVNDFRVRHFVDGSIIEEKKNLLWLSSNDTLLINFNVMEEETIHEINEIDNGEDDLNFYDDDKPTRPLITFNEYVRDHDHW